MVCRSPFRPYLSGLFWGLCHLPVWDPHYAGSTAQGLFRRSYHWHCQWRYLLLPFWKFPLGICDVLRDGICIHVGYQDSSSARRCKPAHRTPCQCPIFSDLATNNDGPIDPVFHCRHLEQVDTKTYSLSR